MYIKFSLFIYLIGTTVADRLTYQDMGSATLKQSEALYAGCRLTRLYTTPPAQNDNRFEHLTPVCPKDLYVYGVQDGGFSVHLHTRNVIIEMYRQLGNLFKTVVDNSHLYRPQDGIHTNTPMGCKDIRGSLSHTFWVEEKNERGRFPFELSWSFGRHTKEAFNVYSLMQDAVSKVVSVLGQKKLLAGYRSNGKP